MQTRYALFVLLVALVSSAGPALAQVEPDPRDWSGVERCASIADAGRRHLCLDQALAAMGLLSQGAAAEVAVEQSSVPEPEPVPQAARAQSAVREPVRSPQGFSGLVSSIRSARLIGRRYVEIEAEDGSRWRSTSSESFRRAPRSGAAFKVERGALRSYNCRIEESTYFKCEPVF